MPVQPTEAYYQGKQLIQKQGLNFESDDMRAMLLDEAHVKNLAATFVNAVAGDEVSGGGYARVPLTNASIDLNVDQSQFDCDKINFGANVTISARYLVIYRHNGPDDSANELLFIIDLSGGGNESSDNAEFSYDPSAQGLYVLDYNEVAA